MSEPELPVVKVVGLSAAGKSTLVDGLRRAGYNARPASQEHSNVPSMWQRLHPPTALIYLHIDLAGQHRRRPDVAWGRDWWEEEHHRLRHARRHARLWIDTTPLGPKQVLQLTCAYLRRGGILRGRGALAPLPQTGSPLA